MNVGIDCWPGLDPVCWLRTFQQDHQYSHLVEQREPHPPSLGSHLWRQPLRQLWQLQQHSHHQQQHPRLEQPNNLGNNVIYVYVFRLKKTRNYFIQDRERKISFLTVSAVSALVNSTRLTLQYQTSVNPVPPGLFTWYTIKVIKSILAWGNRVGYVSAVYVQS